MIMRVAVLIAIVACAISACSSSVGDDAITKNGGDATDGGAADGSEADAGRTALHVLFIGDSYTYVNDLPGMLSSIAATAGTGPTITTDEVVQGGASLEDLWDAGAQTKIQERSWTHVVLQGQ